MMWPRLQLLRELLREDGVIFISIDDHEQHRLRGILDEIFGEENFITNIIWRKKAGGGQDATYFAVEHEYITVYRKSSEFELRPIIVQRDPKTYNKIKDGRRCRFIKLEKWGSNAYREDAPTLFYPITNPDGEPYLPQAPDGRDGNWRKKPEKLSENHIHWERRKGKWTPYEVIYADEESQTKIVKERSIYYNLANTTEVAHEQREIFGERPFPTGKPVGLIKHILKIATAPDDIVLDSFAGSGTTAHAVLALNREDGGARKFILVECEEYADRITAERVRRVIRGLPDAAKPALRAGLGGDFAFHTLGPPLTIDGLLQGDQLPPFATLAAHLLYTASGQAAPAPTTLQPQDEDGFFQTAAGVDYYLLYEPCLDYLRSNAAVLNEERAGRIQKRNQERGRRAVVFAAAKYIGQRKLTQMGITFCQLPYEIQAPPAEDAPWS